MATRKFKPIPHLSESKKQIFLSRIDVRGPDECWPWTHGKFASGYGAYSIKHSPFKAPRIMHFIHTGQDPLELNVLHHCDNPPCCNPRHLFLGSHADNVKDRDQKGRTASGDRSGSILHPERLARGDKNWKHNHPETARGERNPKHKLTEQEVLEIRRTYVKKYGTQKQFASKYGIDVLTLQRILNRERWKHLP